MGGVAAALLPVTTILPVNIENTSDEREDRNGQEKQRFRQKARPYNTAYTGEYLDRVAFPVGGLGAGMFCMEGTGAISHVSIRNKPEIFNEPGMFAAVSVKGKTNGAKLLEGPVPGWKKFGQHDAGNGSAGATTGLPRFRNASFLMRFPFAYLDISDDDLPLKVKITGWSPFIPTDDDNSGLPVGCYGIQIHQYR